MPISAARRRSFRPKQAVSIVFATSQGADRPDMSGVTGLRRGQLPSRGRREETAIRARARRVTVTSLILGVVASTALAVVPAEAATVAAGGTAQLVDAGHSTGRRPDPALRDALQALVDAGATGAIAVVDDGRRHPQAVAVGAGRLEPFEPIRVRDEFRAGSITKTFMSTVTLQLVGEKRLRLNDVVEHWLPGAVPNGTAITIRMLLNHTGGLFDYSEDQQFLAAFLQDPYRTWTPQELLRYAFAHPPLFPAGHGWAYSNTDYVLVGLILQKVTGRSVQQLIRDRIVRPLRLRHTYLPATARFRGEYAHGYFPPSLSGNGYLDVSGWSPSWAWTAGALVSNAPDLSRFYRALLSGHLLRPSLLRMMMTTVPTDRGLDYGLGLARLDLPCGTIWGHDGSVPGYTSYAFTDRHGLRSAVLLIPAQPDTALAPLVDAALGTAVCAIFDSTGTGSIRVRHPRVDQPRAA